MDPTEFQGRESNGRRGHNVRAPTMYPREFSISIRTSPTRECASTQKYTRNPDLQKVRALALAIRICIGRRRWQQHAYARTPGHDCMTTCASARTRAWCAPYARTHGHPPGVACIHTAPTAQRTGRERDGERRICSHGHPRFSISVSALVRTSSESTGAARSLPVPHQVRSRTRSERGGRERERRHAVRRRGTSPPRPAAAPNHSPSLRMTVRMRRRKMYVHTYLHSVSIGARRLHLRLHSHSRLHASPSLSTCICAASFHSHLQASPSTSVDSRTRCTRFAHGMRKCRGGNHSRFIGMNASRSAPTRVRGGLGRRCASSTASAPNEGEEGGEGSEAKKSGLRASAKSVENTKRQVHSAVCLPARRNKARLQAPRECASMHD
jgi:hypothetical protein